MELNLLAGIKILLKGRRKPYFLQPFQSDSFEHLVESLSQRPAIASFCISGRTFINFRGHITSGAYSGHSLLNVEFGFSKIDHFGRGITILGKINHYVIQFDVSIDDHVSPNFDQGINAIKRDPGRECFGSQVVRGNRRSVLLRAEELFEILTLAVLHFELIVSSLVLIETYELYNVVVFDALHYLYFPEQLLLSPISLN